MHPCPCWVHAVGRILITMCVCVCVCVCVRVRVRACVRMRAHVLACILACVLACLCLCTCVYMHVQSNQIRSSWCVECFYIFFLYQYQYFVCLITESLTFYLVTLDTLLWYTRRGLRKPKYPAWEMTQCSRIYLRTTLRNMKIVHHGRYRWFFILVIWNRG